MALSDELMEQPDKLSAIRHELTALASDLNASACFLIDEHGAPFASVGHVEFALPHPLTNLDRGDTVLRALVGEAQDEEPSNVRVERVTQRALLAVVMDAPAPLAPQVRRRLRRSTRHLASLL